MKVTTALMALALAGCNQADSSAANALVDQAKPELALLTSLPIFFSEEFSIEPVASPLRAALEERYDVQLLSNSNAEELAGHELIFMPHPPVQTAEALVDLDEWVRAGGRLLLVADQKVDWPSALPLGDLNRPPPFFMDTGLLAHWGVALSAPSQDQLSELPNRGHGGFSYTSDDCRNATELVRQMHDQFAYCRIGEGHVLILPDVDQFAAAGPEADWRQSLPAQLDWLASR